MANTKIRAPKVSVLIPVFNRKEYIAECIQSALNQSFTDFEVVVVDNASDDGTWEICQQFEKVDQRVRIFRNQINIGPVRNWIRCAEEAKGSLSKILFSDDTLEPECLIKMVAKLEDSDIALVFCAACIGKSKSESIIAYSHSDSSVLSSRRFLNLVLSGKAPVSPGAILIRTFDLLKNLHTTFPTSTPRCFEKNGAGPDVMILLMTSKDYPAVANIEEPLVFFRAHSGSFTIENQNNDVIKGYESVFSWYLLKYHNKKIWLFRLSNSWLQTMLFTKKWRHPSEHLREFEGSGNFAEVVALSIFVSVNLVGFVLRYLRGKASLAVKRFKKP